jgi:ABC-2 type transport system permease protein
MAAPLRLASDVLPLSYAVDLGRHIAFDADVTSDVARDLTILTAAVVVALVLAATTLRRRTA